MTLKSHNANGWGVLNMVLLHKMILARILPLMQSSSKILMSTWKRHSNHGISDNCTPENVLGLLPINASLNNFSTVFSLAHFGWLATVSP